MLIKHSNLSGSVLRQNDDLCCVKETLYEVPLVSQLIHPHRECPGPFCYLTFKFLELVSETDGGLVEDIDFIACPMSGCPLTDRSAHFFESTLCQEWQVLSCVPQMRHGCPQQREKQCLG